MAKTTATQIRKGNDLMVFMGGEALAFATNHTFSCTVETETVQSKDSGYNGAELPKRLTWEITSENLYIDGEYDKLFTAMQAKQAVELVWGVASGDTSVAITAPTTPETMAADMHSAPASGGYKGSAFLTSLNVNAQAGENATYSVTFTGTGDITKQ